MMIERKVARRPRWDFPHYTMLAWELMFGNELPKSPGSRRKVFERRCYRHCEPLHFLAEKEERIASFRSSIYGGQIVACAPLRKRFAFVAGNDAESSPIQSSNSREDMRPHSRDAKARDA
jgi:hypothetical protein